ncbi:hypothetical protein WA538_000710, partial [Blastocystis sp. DL]
MSGSQPVLQLPVASVSAFERRASACKERGVQILVVSLLLFLSSLSAAYFVVDTVITRPTYTDVRESYSVPLGVENENSTYAAENQYQKNTFDRCVQASIDYCNTTLSADNDVESTRSMDAERHNNRVVHSLMSITEAMEAIVSNATVILQPVIPFNGVCSKKERSYLQSVYQSDPEMDAFVSLLETGTNQTVSAYRQVLQQFDARMEYDATYLGSKLSLLELNQSQLLSEMALSASDIVGVLSNFNATQFVRCVTMDASCNLTHSLYNQYTAIRAQHEASKQLIRQQYLYRHSSPFSQ